ncbi:hypothetical protein Micbo1qcDRAFT_207624 [Microdochium bolleyi]|uniref:Hydrophobic surface binding protein A-domain-containing protein n=1 Tax=Microdochium bolleyi TaxID=196109 RepID=A0A136ISE5_9PEZI|nr:hypothetical protein Micbo1qcDRAFT_207624 [Microdochium bolleyi]
MKFFQFLSLASFAFAAPTAFDDSEQSINLGARGILLDGVTKTLADLRGSGTGNQDVIKAALGSIVAGNQETVQAAAALVTDSLKKTVVQIQQTAAILQAASASANQAISDDLKKLVAAEAAQITATVAQTQVFLASLGAGVKLLGDGIRDPAVGAVQVQIEAVRAAATTLVAPVQGLVTALAKAGTSNLQALITSTTLQGLMPILKLLIAAI